MKNLKNLLKNLLEWLVELPTVGKYIHTMIIDDNTIIPHNDT